MDTDDVLIACYLLVGIGLLLNPLYLYPAGGGPYEMTYQVEEIETEADAIRTLNQATVVLDCPAERPCVLEQRVLKQGPIRYDEPVQRGQSYEVVQIDGSWYRPVNQVENDTTVLTLESIGRQTAVEHAAIDVDNASTNVATAINTGSVTVYGKRIETFERGAIVESGGRHYYKAGFRYRTHWTGGGGLTLVRAALVLLGAGVLVRTLFVR